MKKVLIISLLLILAIIFSGCGECPTAELDSWDGRETVITEETITEETITEQRVYTVRDGKLVDITEEMDVLPEIVTFENVEMKTWD